MDRLPVGMIILLIVTALIFFGLAHRALDRMKLTDKQALWIILGLIAGSFINIPLPLGRYSISINAGGALIPFGLAIYLILTAGSRKEKIRSIVGAVITGIVIYGIDTLFMRGLPEPAGRYGFLDTMWLFPLVAGIVGYISGRSRRGAFVSATLGMLAFDAGYYIWLVSSGAPAGRVNIGGAGAFDAIVLAGIFAILLAETVGETIERLSGGPSTKGRDPSLVSALRKPQTNQFKENTGEETGDNMDNDSQKGGSL